MCCRYYVINKTKYVQASHMDRYELTTAKLHIIHSMTTLLSNLHYLQALPTAAGRNLATTGAQRHHFQASTDASSMDASPSSYGAHTTYTSAVTWVPRETREVSTSVVHRHASPVRMGFGTVNAYGVSSVSSPTPFRSTDLAHLASDAVPSTAQQVPSVTRSEDDMSYASPLLDLPTAPLMASPPTAKPVLVQSTVSASPNAEHETVSAKPVHTLRSLYILCCRLRPRNLSVQLPVAQHLGFTSANHVSRSRCFAA